MPNWKKIAISGSNISQFNNDGIYAKMKGSTNNGLLTYESAETASVESNITYDGSIQKLVNNGQTNIYSGSFISGQEPNMGASSALKLTSLLSPSAAAYHYTGSQNGVLSVVGRHSSFGSNSNCGATINLTSQVGNSSKNASVQLTSIGKTNNCHDAIFTIGVRCDDGSQESFINEMARFDAKDHDITLTGSLYLDPTHVASSGSLGSILVYDNVTGEIKKSTLTPPSSNSVTSVNGQTGVVTLSIPTNNNQLTNGAGYKTTDECIGTICGENASGGATSEANVDTIEFQCAAITTATNEATVKIHSSTNSSNKAQIPFPDANNQLIGCNNIYVCTSHENNAALFNCGGGLGAFNNNNGSAQKFSVIREAFKGSNFMTSTANTVAPIYNIKDSTIGGYTKQIQTSSINILGNQTTGGNKFARIQLVHCNTVGDKAAAVHLDTVGADASSDRTDFAINVRGEDSLFYRRMHIESDSTTSANSNITFSGSLHVDTSQMSTSASLASVLVYDNATGEIKKSTLTPSEGGGGTPAGTACSIQFANAAVDAFDGEGDFTYDKLNNEMSVCSIVTQTIKGNGNNLVITDDDNDACVFICSFNTEKAIFGECNTEIGEASNSNASVINRAVVKIPDGTSSKPGIAFTNDSDMGLYRSGTSAILGLNDSQAAASYEFQVDGLKVVDGALAVGNISPSTTTGRIDASNDIVAYSTSDCRLKKYVKPIKNALDKIDKIRGVEFDWKVTDGKMEKEVHSFEGHDVGVIAQEIEEVLPEVVTTRDSGYKAVRYEKIVPLLIQGIKELKDEVEILKSKI